LRALSVTREPLTIIYCRDDTAGVISAVQKGHHILVPLTHGRGRNIDHLVLSRQPPDAFVRALVEAGLSEERSWALVRETGRSITALQRRLTAVAASAPLWALPPAAHDLIPLLLADSWDEQRDTDRELLVELVGKPYEETSRIAVTWSQTADAPLRHIGSTWTFVAPRDAWDQLSTYLTPGHLERFVVITERVLSLADPRLDLAPNERWLAGIRHKEPVHSLELREGLTRSLVMLSVLGDEGVVEGRPQDVVRHVIARILSPAAGWRRWYSLAPLLQLLAEAAPDEFLTALHEHLRPAVPELLHLFEDEGGYFSHSEHTHLLWALEVLAWQPQYLSSVSLALGRLASLDPGGKLHNRPSNTLRGIFLLWHPNTIASLRERFGAIDLLLKREPTVGWELICMLLPKSYDVGETNAQPQWRTVVAPPAVTRGEHFQGVMGVLERACRAARMQGVRLALLVKEIGQWPSDVRDALLTQIRTFAQTITDDGERFIMWEALREVVHQHRSYPDAEWVLPAPALEVLEELMRLLTPADPVSRYAWLFADWWPALDRPRADLIENDAYLSVARQEAVGATLRERGTAGVMALGRTGQYPGLVGVAMADITREAEQQAFLLATLGSAHKSDRVMGMGYSSRCYERGGEQWLNDLLATPLPDNIVASILLGLPSARSVWERARAMGDRIEERYWREVGVWLTTASPLDDVVFAVEHLLRVDRPFVALQLCGHQGNRLPGELLLRVLDAVTESLAGGVTMPSDYDFLWALEQVFTALQASEVDETAIARREWTYLPLLSRGHHMPHLLLHRVLAREPSLFADAVRAAFRPHHREEHETITENDRARASVAYECLSSFHVVPGTDGEGTIDPLVLNAWVEEARRLCAADDRAAIGDQQIGHVLAFAPVGPDGTWPSAAVRGVLERIAAEDIETGMIVSVRNQRGVFTKGLTDGGAQERGLAASYRTYATALAITSPRTAAMARRIADSYEADAHREDVRAAQRDLG